jgi:selenocysteine lyase/cysteine desulfurase
MPGLVSFEVEGASPRAAVGLLLDEQFVLRPLPQPRPYLQANTHLFNTEEELGVLAKAVGGM